jgi:hypothetical protein
VGVILGVVAVLGELGGGLEETGGFECGLRGGSFAALRAWGQSWSVRVVV